MRDLITIDFETFYSKTFSLSKMTTEAYIRSPEFEVIGVGVKVNDTPAEWCSGTHGEIKAFLDQYDWANAKVIAHNMAFDGAILSWHFGIVPYRYIDTLSMARPVTQATVGGSLAKLAKKFCLGEKGTEVIDALGKRRLEFTSSDLAQYGNYCKNDVELTYLLYHVLEQFSTPAEMFVIDLMIRMYTDPVLVLDKPLLENHLQEVQAKKQRLLAKVDQIAGGPELMSNQQFAAVLQKLGVEPPTKISLRTNKETYAFGKNDLAFKALLEHPDERVQAVVAARLGVKSTLEETRTESFIGIAERGALPIMLNYYGAHTGRASGGDKVNLQNLPRGGALRHAIKAPEGHVIVASDSSQIEARVVAWLAGQDELVGAFAEGRDIYSEFATSVYGKTVTKSDKVERFVGKTCILGLGYGMGKDKFQTTLKVGQGGIAVDIDIQEAERIVNLYRTKYDKIVALWGDAQKALKAMVSGYEYMLGSANLQLRCTPDGIELPNGMWVRYHNLRMQDGQAVYDSRYGSTKIYGGKVIENVVQALARIVVFDQMAVIDKKFRPLDAPERGVRMRTALTVHDEVVAVVPEPVKDKALALMTRVMQLTPSWAAGLPVACEADAAKSYGECK